MSQEQRSAEQCPYCKQPRRSDGSICHLGHCEGLTSVIINRLQHDALVAARDALRDISWGAKMMLEAPVPAVHRYAGEVRRVAEAGLKGNSNG